MKMQNEKVLSLISGFERKFGDSLKELNKQESDNYTRYFRIFPAKKKYSDWDLHCWLNDSADLETIKEMKSFVFTKDFSSLGNFVTNSNEYKKNDSYIKNIKQVQLMGYIPKTEYAPFLDLTIKEVGNEIATKLYQREYHQEFIDWSIITALRKYKNENYNGRNGFMFLMANYILPGLSAKKQKQIIDNPKKELENLLDKLKYQKVINFLKS